MMSQDINFCPYRRSNSRLSLVRHTLFSLGCLLMLLIFVSDASCEDYLFEQEPKKLALVIGNRNYTNLGPIESSQTDGETMKQRLSELGFDVSYYPDVPTLNNFQNVIFKEFRKKIDPGDFVVFYFSGHGFSYGQDNYLAPTEMPLSIPEDKVTRYAISVDAFEGLVASHSPGLIMFFIDACRSIGGFIIKNKQEVNVVGKGPSPQLNNDVGSNSAIFYATKPGMFAEGFSSPGQLSTFTRALVDHIGTEGQPFGTIFNRIKATVRVMTSSNQIPGDYNFSATDPYFKPTDKNLEDQREAWRSALRTGSSTEIELFSLLNSVSRHSAACRKWLEDQQNSSSYTSASPVAIDRAWDPSHTSRRSVLRLSGPFAFNRTLEASQVEAVEELPDAKIGLVPTGTSPQLTDPLDFSMTNIDAHRTVVATQKLEGRADPNISATVVERIPAGTELQINNVAVIGTDNNMYVRASTPGEQSPFFIRIPQKLSSPEPLELGQSVQEIIAPPRPDSIPELVDPAPIQQAITELKAQGWKITWVSLSSAPTDNKLEQNIRTLRLANARYILKRAGIELRRITSASGREDFSGDGVRVRFFGVKQD
jgi:hypothetical protein